MPYNFTNIETQKIIEHHGQAFYNKILKDLAVYVDKWKLKIYQLVDYYSVNCIFICHSELYGDAILKIGKPCREIYTELNALREYHGRRFCSFFDHDIENGIILEEYIQPGTRLRAEKSLDKRLSVFSSLYNGLHVAPADSSVYPTYIDWVSRTTEDMSKREDHKELYLYMKKAKKICISIESAYSKQMLLHGDFHHDNILLNSNNEYKIIDPKGAIGDPVFDVPRFILNEFEDEISEQFCKKITYIINYFEKSLNIPSKTIKQCLFVEMSMANCWNVESGETPKLDHVIFTETIINS